MIRNDIANQPAGNASDGTPEPPSAMTENILTPRPCMFPSYSGTLHAPRIILGRSESTAKSQKNPTNHERIVSKTPISVYIAGDREKVRPRCIRPFVRTGVPRAWVRRPARGFGRYVPLPAGTGLNRPWSLPLDRGPERHPAFGWPIVVRGSAPLRIRC